MLKVGELYIVFVTKIFKPVSVAVQVVHFTARKTDSSLHWRPMTSSHRYFPFRKVGLQRNVALVKFSPRVTQKSAAGQKN